MAFFTGFLPYTDFHNQNTLNKTNNLHYNKNLLYCAVLTFMNQKWGLCLIQHFSWNAYVRLR
jgi:hypothetical protein